MFQQIPLEIETCAVTSTWKYYTHVKESHQKRTIDIIWTLKPCLIPKLNNTFQTINVQTNDYTLAKDTIDNMLSKIKQTFDFF